ncbi:MAG TPA: LLM class flavin-dependent oxidoreductase [Actinomycetota bacterium]|nr:LLM class flavin-dependent oxidoreductase [Actinomycetota bacterium]
MRLGLILPLFSGDPAKVLGAAQDSEHLGYDGVFAFDHFFPPGAPRDRPALEAFTSLAGVAAVTQRVAIGTMVTRASLRPAGMLAKTAAWLDTASGGRMVLGIGTGDPIDRPEHEAYGIPMFGRKERREHLEETVEAVKALFSGHQYAGGRLVPPMAGPLEPPPASPGGPPVWIGAQADEVVAMAGRLAEGWNGWGLEGEEFSRKVDILRAAAGDRAVEASWAGVTLVGTDDAETRVLAERRRERGIGEADWTGSVDELIAFLEGLAAAGATWAVMVLAGPPDRRALIAERVLPAVARTQPTAPPVTPS